MKMSKKVRWLQGQASNQPISPYHVPKEFDVETEKLYASQLYVGALWVANVDLSAAPRSPSADLPTVLRAHPSPHYRNPRDQTFLAGTPAIYMGTSRAEELGRSGNIIRALKHTFIIGGIKYAARNLVDFKPAEASE